MQGTILSQISGEEPNHRPLFLTLTTMQTAAFSESSIDVIITGENLIKDWCKKSLVIIMKVEEVEALSKMTCD